MAFDPRRIIAATTLAIAITGGSGQAQTYEYKFKVSEGKIAQASRIVNEWQEDQKWAFRVVVVIALLGAITAGLQLTRDGSWKPIATGVLGVLVTVITALNTAFVPADYKTLTKRINGGRNLIESMKSLLSAGQMASMPADKEDALSEIAKTLVDFHNLAAGERDMQASVDYVSFGAVLHAQASRICNCAALQRNLNSDFVYTCGTAEGKSLAATREAAGTKAVEAMAARLQTGQSNQQRAGDTTLEYVRRVGSRVDSCVSVDKGGSFSATVLMRMPSSLTDQDAQTAFAPSASIEPARVPNAAGEIPFLQNTNRIQFPVRASPPRFGDFLFTFTVLPGAPRILQLQDIRVVQDGSAGTTRWSFDILFDDKVVGTIASSKYSDEQKPAVYRIPSTIALPANPPLRVKVLGYKP